MQTHHDRVLDALDGHAAQETLHALVSTNHVNKLQTKGNNRLLSKEHAAHVWYEWYDFCSGILHGQMRLQLYAAAMHDSF